MTFRLTPGTPIHNHTENVKKTFSQREHTKMKQSHFLPCLTAYMLSMSQEKFHTICLQRSAAGEFLSISQFAEI